MGKNNSKYIESTQFQEALIDKETGEPLAYAKVYTYRDTDRTPTGLKPLYVKVDDSPDNQYVELPNPVILSSIGTFNYSNNDINPYFYPYDENGNLDLYYIRVVNANDVEQFTRVAEPNLSAEAAPEEGAQEINYIPNGQFIAHNDILKTETVEEGEITQDVTEIAPGNWTFERSSGSAAKDFVLFDRIASATLNPTGNPRYAVRAKCENPDVSDTFKAIRVKFRDVNKFSSPANQDYNFSFSAKTNLGGQATITVRAFKDFGTGGSPEEDIFITTKTITNSFVTYSEAFTVPDNIGKTISSDDDDFIALEISFSTSILFDNSFTDFFLKTGSEQPINYPITTTNEDMYRGLAGSTPVPSYDGSNLYLPVINTPNGFAFDDSQIGTIVYKPFDALSRGELYCDGAAYLKAAQSSDGIAYSRLFNKLWYEPLLLTRYGTGKGFVNAFPYTFTYPMDENKIKVYENSFGATTSAADGTVGTGFTFNDEQTGVDYQNAYIFSVQTVAGSSITEGAYFKFYTPSQFPVPPSPSAKKYLVWYSKLTTSTAPTETADGKIKVLYSDSDTDKDIAKKTLLAINQYLYAVPDYRGKFLRINDKMGFTTGDIGYIDLDVDYGVVGIYRITNGGASYAVGDLVEIPGSTDGLNAKLKVLTVGGAGDVTNILLILPGHGYGGAPGRFNNATTNKITGSGNNALQIDIELGEKRSHSLLMDEAPDNLFDRYFIGTKQLQDTAALTRIIDVGGGEESPLNHTFAGDASGKPYIKMFNGSTDYMAHDAIIGKRSFKEGVLDTTNPVREDYVEAGWGHETRPTNNSIIAVIKY